MPRSPNEKQLVAKGAAFMDKILPGWHRRVKLDRLNMSNGMMCLLGQTFGVHAEGSLAKEMYPEEFKASIHELVEARGEMWGSRQYSKYGYVIASVRLRQDNPQKKGGMISKIMHKLGLASATQDLDTLEKVCWGHDNRCEWSEEIAKRLAKDEVEKEVGDA